MLVGLADRPGRPGRPPPAKAAEKTAAQWSRPSRRVVVARCSARSRGVRPNSPVMTTSVSSSRPRPARSSSRAETPRSVGGRSRSLRRLEVARVGVPGLDPPHVHLDDRHARPRRAAGPAGATGRTCAGRSGRGPAGLPRSRSKARGDLAREQERHSASSRWSAIGSLAGAEPRQAVELGRRARRGAPAGRSAARR